MTQTSKLQLGAAYHPFHGEQLENPYPFYAVMRKQEPITYSPEVGAWLVSRYSDLRLILSQPDVFSSRDLTRPLAALDPAAIEILRQGYPMVPSAANSDGLNHQRFRAPYIKALAPSRIAAHEGHIRTIANRLVDAIVNDGHAEIISQFAYPLPLEVILTIVGIPQERIADAKNWCRDLIALIFSPVSQEHQVECAKGMVAFQHYLAELIAERRRTPRADLISEMITYQIPGAQSLTTEELISALCGFLMAGHKTTVDLVGNGLALLLHPISQWQMLCTHPELISSTVDEILRYDCPVQALYRTTTREATVGGVTLAAGTQVLLVFGSANRDEVQFPNAGVFEMQRTPNRHLAFGYASHFCVGASLARLEGRIAFEILTQRLPNMRLLPNQRLAHAPVLAFRGYQQLEIEW